MNDKPNLKFCAVRLENDLHKRAKVRACELGVSLQDWLKELIKLELERERK